MKAKVLCISRVVTGQAGIVEIWNFFTRWGTTGFTDRRQDMKWIIKNWLILAAGIILTALAVRYAYHERGYIAVGSEWTVLPFMFLLRALYREIKEEVKQWL